MFMVTWSPSRAKMARNRKFFPEIQRKREGEKEEAKFGGGGGSGDEKKKGNNLEKKWSRGVMCT